MLIRLERSWLTTQAVFVVSRSDSENWTLLNLVNDALRDPIGVTRRVAVLDTTGSITRCLRNSGCSRRRDYWESKTQVTDLQKAAVSICNPAEGREQN